MIDGDDVRQILGRENLDDYTPAGRRAVAEPIAAMCKWLDDQEINVVCCTISSFPDLLSANRTRFHKYFEVFIDVPMDIVATRSDSDLYDRAHRGEIENVVGVDIPYTPPETPDLVIDNAADAAEFSAIASTILTRASVI